MVIAESTRRLIGNLFELEDLGTYDLKGIPGAGASLGGAATGFVEVASMLSTGAA